MEFVHDYIYECLFRNEYMIDMWINNKDDILLVRSMTFTNIFNKYIRHYPDFVEYIKFGNMFNRCVHNLPMFIKTLIFGRNFNMCINKFPKYIENIVFGEHYNKPVNMLTVKIKNIRFGREFKQSLKNVKSIQTLEIFYKYANMLPQLKKIIFIAGYRENLMNVKHNNLPYSSKKIIYKLSCSKSYILNNCKKIPYGCVVENSFPLLANYI